MELKEAILSTIEEMEEEIRMPIVTEADSESEEENKPFKRVEVKEDAPKNKIKPKTKETLPDTNISEEAFLENLREKILVIFEGFQHQGTKNIETKVELTLNFLEYLLANIEDRLSRINDNEK